MSWNAAARLDEIDDDIPFALEIGANLIALVKVDGEVHAVSNVCTHQFALMSDGFVDGEYIECPLHQGRFHIATGKAMGAPVCEDLKTYPVKIEDGSVFVACD